MNKILPQFSTSPPSWQGKTVAVTGASGALGQALLRHFHDQGATIVALSSQAQPLTLVRDSSENPVPVKTVQWQVGQEAQLIPVLATIDILVLNHGVNVHAARSPEAIEQSYQINAFSQVRLLELFLKSLENDPDQSSGKEVWVNTSEAEVNPAFSPLYELSKRTLGDLITLRRLDAPCVLRKLILGPFRSSLNPLGILSPDWVARQILQLARGDRSNIIVTINPLTYLLFPLKEWAVSTYFRLLTKPETPPENPPETPS